MKRLIQDIFSFKDFPKTDRIIFYVFLLFILVFPWLGFGSYYRAIMIDFLLFSLYGLGWNLIGGYGGQVALGQAKNVGMAAYATSLMTIWWNVPFWLTVPVAILVSVTESFILGYALFRLRSHYFVIATITVSLVWQELFIFWDWTGGSRGISLPLAEHTPNLYYMQFDSSIGYHYFIFFFFICALLYMNWFRKSKLGYQLRAIRENEDAAESLGINIMWAKVKAYCITAVMAAVGGSFYAVYHLYIDPRSVMQLNLSILIAMMAMVGGAGSMWGPLLGAMVLIPLDRLLGAWLGGSGILGMDFMIYAAVIMVIAAYQPRGIWGIIEDFRGQKGGG